MNKYLLEKIEISPRNFRVGLLLTVVLMLFLCGPVMADETAKMTGKGFSSPQAAVAALAKVAAQADTEGVLALLGEDAGDIVFSGDKVESKGELTDFARSIVEKHDVEMITPTSAQLTVGADEWVFPIPIIKNGEKWYFDVAAGRDELLNRRIGRNELSVIQVMLDYVNAQMEYASRDRDGDGIREYAQKIKSDPDKKNGLYWPVAEGDQESPFGPFIAQASREGYSDSSETAEPKPYNGYYYKLITRQGKNAPGGAYDYIVNGNMILGFGMLAYPAKYGVSGIMTFAVNQEGVVYESDLGEKTADLINQTVKYNPDEHIWHKVDDQYLESE
jgi:hypothetical protein